MEVSGSEVFQGERESHHRGGLEGGQAGGPEKWIIYVAALHSTLPFLSSEIYVPSAFFKSASIAQI